MSKFNIRHITRYTYEGMVRDSANQVMLYPISDEYQEVLLHSIQVTGNPVIHSHEDYYSNRVGTFTQSLPHDELTIDSQLTVLTKHRLMPEAGGDGMKGWEELERYGVDALYIDFLTQERFGMFTELHDIVEAERCKNCSPFDTALDFCKYVYDTFTYRKGITTVETTLDEIWKLKTGVCQDFAHILLVMLRQMHIPARYVSGYVCPNKSGMRGEGATHAWVEAYIPSYGWLGLDPTNNCLVNETHVRLAVGRNFSDCSPVKGTYRGTSDHTLEVSVSVSYENEPGPSANHEVVFSAPSTSLYRNSFRKHQEMQMQQ